MALAAVCLAFILNRQPVLSELGMCPGVSMAGFLKALIHMVLSPLLHSRSGFRGKDEYQYANDVDGSR